MQKQASASLGRKTSHANQVLGRFWAAIWPMQLAEEVVASSFSYTATGAVDRDLGSSWDLLGRALGSVTGAHPKAARLRGAGGDSKAHHTLTSPSRVGFFWWP